MSAKDAINPRACPDRIGGFPGTGTGFRASVFCLKFNHALVGQAGKPHGDPRIGLRGFCCLSLRVQKRGQKEIIRPDSKNQDGPIARGNTPT